MIPPAGLVGEFKIHGGRKSTDGGWGILNGTWESKMEIPDKMETRGERRINLRRKFILTLSIAICTCGLLLSANAQQPSRSNTSQKASHWTLGIYTGPSPLQLSSPANVSNPVLTAADVHDLKNVDTLAHPFMVIEGSRYYMFFTAKYLKTGESGIGLAESDNGRVWHYKHLVIKEPYTLSYPYVFKWQNDYYMVPEAHTETFVRLYKATAFPNKWEYQKDLLTGDHFIQPTLVRYKDMWWMFVCPSGNETLRLFYASDFKGPWTEHPLSPVIKKDIHTSRTAGRPFILDGKLYRLGMDCLPVYGYQVHAFQITDISTKTYAEKMIDAPVVKATGKGWNAEAMHTVDAHQIGRNLWIAAVDALGD